MTLLINRLEYGTTDNNRSKSLKIGKPVPMKQTILIIEDEPAIVDTISYPLETEGFETVWAPTGTGGLEELANREVHLVILDIGLPDISGFDLLKDIRKDRDLPVLFLTARTEEIDRVVGLELGADDYIMKPFSPRELTARVKAVLRRYKSEEFCENTDNNRFQVDENRRIIRYQGEKLDLTRYEYEILHLFMRNPGWVFSRERIMDLIWEEPEESFERTVDAHIKTIRAKLRALTPDCDPIATHRGIGYSLRDDL